MPASAKILTDCEHTVLRLLSAVVSHDRSIDRLRGRGMSAEELRAYLTLLMEDEWQSLSAAPFIAYDGEKPPAESTFEDTFATLLCRVIGLHGAAETIADPAMSEGTVAVRHNGQMIYGDLVEIERTSGAGMPNRLRLNAVERQ